MIYHQSPQDDDDDNEIIIGGRWPHASVEGPNDDGKGTDDGEAGKKDDNNDWAPGHQVGGPHGPRGTMCGCRSEVPPRPKGPVAPAFVNLDVKCLIFSAKEGEDTESNLFTVVIGCIHKALQKLQNVVGFAWLKLVIPTCHMN